MQPELRAAAESNDMELPPGYSCNDCAYYIKCVNLFGCKASNTSCDWSPSKFVWSKGRAFEQALANVRDAVLHGRGPLAEMDVDSDIINAVLGIIDDEWPAAPPKEKTHAT